MLCNKGVQAVVQASPDGVPVEVRQVSKERDLTGPEAMQQLLEMRRAAASVTGGVGLRGGEDEYAPGLQLAPAKVAGPSASAGTCRPATPRCVARGPAAGAIVPWMLVAQGGLVATSGGRLPFDRGESPAGPWPPAVAGIAHAGPTAPPRGPTDDFAVRPAQGPRGPLQIRLAEGDFEVDELAAARQPAAGPTGARGRAESDELKCGRAWSLAA
ncbi:unnamed protein product [Prorocentrum cordatum]|uniref:Uncharacterized protein n=1 Tax=Prorocentrum cordatum TaxID=2364126 RepID=A0ABN9SIT0_9DINO|nr:unnamed protein product [Polarella glacialis]